MSNKTLERIFQFVAAILLGVAAIFFWQDNYEGIFVFGVLSFASYFLSFRFQVKDRLENREAESLERELDEMNMNRNILQENTSLFDIEETDFEKGKEKVLNEK